MSTLPIPPLSALPPASNAANTSLRWTAHRHHESLQTFLRMNSTLSQELEELKGSKNTLTQDDAALMVADIRNEMEKTVDALKLRLEGCQTQLSRQKGELDAKDLKMQELQGSSASSLAALTAEIESLRGKVGNVESENASLRSERGDQDGDIERLRILNEELELENQVGHHRS
jgi:chromosome segregation ATPase